MPVALEAIYTGDKGNSEEVNTSSGTTSLMRPKPYRRRRNRGEKLAKKFSMAVKRVQPLIPFPILSRH